MLVVCTFYTVNRVLTICYGLITSTRIVAIFFWTTAFHLTINTKTWIPTWLFTVIPDESNRTIWNDVKLFLCFLDFYSLFVKMDYINIKKKFPFCWKKCYTKMILVFSSEESNTPPIARKSGPTSLVHRVHICASLYKCLQDVMWFHADTCNYWFYKYLRKLYNMY